MMDRNLLFLLLVSVIAVVFVVYLVVRHKRRKRELLIFPKFDQSGRIEPDLTSAMQEPLEFADLLSEPLLSESNSEESHRDETAQAAETSHFEQLLVIHVMAQSEQSFMGYELLQALLTIGLRYGDMHIFHRYQSYKGSMRLLFSLASATEPGTFDLNNMGGFSCRGLSLFMNLNHLKYDAHEAFELMWETAQQLAYELGGDIYNDIRQPLGSEELAKYRQRIAALYPEQGKSWLISEPPGLRQRTK